MMRLVHPAHLVVRSTASLDGPDETYMALLGKLLAGIVATFLGTSLIIAAAIGIRPGTDAGLLVLGGGVALIMLSLDQIWRVMRKLG